MPVPEVQEDHSRAKLLHYHCSTLAGAILKLELLTLTEQLSPDGATELATVIQSLRQTCVDLRSL